MSRRIVAVSYQAKGAAREVDTYFDRVVMYIPADVVSGWVFVKSAIEGAPEDTPKPVIWWLAFVCGLALTAGWTLRQTKEPARRAAITQIIVATIAFAVWVFAMGGPFATLGFYKPLYGSLVLVLYTLAVGLIIPRE